MSQLKTRSTAILGGLSILLSVGIGAASGQVPNRRPQTQYGENQVRDDRFDFEVLETEHFDIYFYGEEAEMARVAGRMAERWYARLSRLLAHDLRGRQPIVLYAGHPHFHQTTTVPGMRGETARGVTEAWKRRIVMPFAGPLAETDHVIGHEMVHAFQFDMTQRDAKSPLQDGLPRALRMPLWFIEGMAVYLTTGPSDPISAMWVRDAAIDGQFPTLQQLTNNRAFAFRFGHGLWAYITGRFGDDVIGRILNQAAQGASAREAIRSVLLVPIDTLVVEWEDAVSFAFADWIEQANESEIAATMAGNGGYEGQLNLAPALSPDGKQVVYISNRNGRSVDMFLGDADTGERRGDLGLIAATPRFEYIQFISAAGEWSPDGERFAYGDGSDFDAKLVIMNPENGNRELSRAFPGIGEIFDPTWSPDGRFVAFSGLFGGQSDLFVYDRVVDSLSRLTNDKYAELLPAWSPDGSSIVFTTDRYTTDLRTLRYGHYRLASIDPTNGDVAELPFVEGMNHVNPQWAANGASVFFVGDRGGLTNVYRYDLGSKLFFQVSNVFTGIAGVTTLSPSLSSARAVDKLAFSVYRHGVYRIETMEGREVLRGRRLAR